MRELHPTHERNEPPWPADRAGFAQLFREHYSGLCALARRYVGDPALAEELVQDVFLALWQQRLRLELRGSIRTYLFTAVRNAALNQLKHRDIVERLRHDVTLATAPKQADADEAARYNELVTAVEAAIRDLPEKARLVLTLSRDAGLTYAEIAQTLGVSIKAVEGNLSRALRILRERLKPYLDDRI